MSKSVAQHRESNLIFFHAKDVTLVYNKNNFRSFEIFSNVVEAKQLAKIADMGFDTMTDWWKDAKITIWTMYI